jgi:GT2 family glycosyltransferase
MLKIVVGLVTFNHSEHELNCWLTSFRKTTQYAKQQNHDIDIKLLWIDNGCVKEAFQNQPDCRSLPTRGNVGYTVAINLLMQEAIATERADYFLSANPDGMFHPFFIHEILQFAARFPDALIEATQFPEEHPKHYDPTTYNTPWASGCACLYPAKIIETVGLMDENFFLYCEDVDFSWRTRLHGFEIKHCPTAKFGHYVLNRKASQSGTKFIYDSGRYLAAKWGNKPFEEWCNKVLLEEGIYASPNELPLLKTTPLAFNKTEIDNVVDFENHFHFSRGRW